MFTCHYLNFYLRTTPVSKRELISGRLSISFKFTKLVNLTCWAAHQFHPSQNRREIGDTPSMLEEGKIGCFPVRYDKTLGKSNLRKEGFVLAQDEDIVHDDRDSTVAGRWGSWCYCMCHSGNERDECSVQLTLSSVFCLRSSPWWPPAFRVGFPTLANPT